MASHKKYTFTGIGSNNEVIVIEADVNKAAAKEDEADFITFRISNSDSNTTVSVNSIIALELADTLISLVEEKQTYDFD